jgi:NAD(P)-dependent dehydrogenase (short-subunit alcohol dehydrogenase family)
MTGMNAIVVGVSSTLGRAVANELSKRGARVGGTFLRGEDAAAALGRELPGFVARRLDLATAADIERVIAELAGELGGVDVLVHCATIASAARTESYDRLADVDPDALAKMLAVNVSSPLFCARALAAARATTERTRNLILVGSIDGAKSLPTATPYATSKGAVVAMVRALAKELGPSILVNCVAPGVLDSGITRVVPEDVKKEYLKHSAMKRFGTHDEVARSIAWLALENTYITGQTLLLDGGL